MSNPFNQSLDWALRGKYVHVIAQSGTEMEGWVDRVHHQKGSIVLHGASVKRKGSTRSDYGSVYVRTVDEVYVIKPRKRIAYPKLTWLQPHPLHDGDFEVVAKHVQSAHRHQFTDSFPVITQDKIVLNGHKRIRAARMAGMERHPCEEVYVTEKQSNELFKLAHPEIFDTTEFVFPEDPDDG